MSERTAVAMSGGLDSSVVAWLLSRDDPGVIGLSMLLWDESGAGPGSVPAAGRCCGALDLGDARRVAEQCGIAHYTIEMEDDFRREVVDPFVDAYLDGRTPVPCTRCNTFIKFDRFVERARRLGAGTIATGHYARVEQGDDGWELHAAIDGDKDQSYYLFELTQEQLAVSHFPLGHRRKSEIRELAREAGLLVAEKGESMELCFVSGSVREFVEEQAANHPDRYSRPVGGDDSRLVDRDGNTLGSGEPYYRYTVGQRRGLGLTSPSPLYVLGVEPDSNEVRVGDAEALDANGLLGTPAHWIGSQPAGEVEATVRIRSRHAGVESRIRMRSDGTTEVRFAEPQRSVAPGQAAVFYQGTRVLGGCWIEASLD